MNLFEIDAEIRSVLDNVSIDEETGEIIGEIDFARLEELNIEKTRKIEGLALFSKELDAEIKALKLEKQSIQKRIDSKESRLESLKDYLTTVLISSGENRFETAKTVLSFRKSVAVKITNEEALPKSVLVKKVSFSPDKVLIKQLISSGKKVRGAELEMRNSIQIK